MATKAAKKVTPFPRAKPHDNGRLTARDKVQTPLPGAEQEPKIPAIHAAALNYRQAADDAGAAASEAKSKKLRLVEVMNEYGKTRYEHGNVRVDLDDVTKVSVTITTEDE